MRRAVLIPLALLTGCRAYSDFTLPVQPGGPQPVKFHWTPQSQPVLSTGPTGSWDSTDVLNPSVLKTSEGTYVNYYSGFDGTSWRTGKADSPDGVHWTKRGVVLSPPDTGDRYIAANGSAIVFRGGVRYYYQSGRTARILNFDGQHASQPALQPGPFGSWDERGVADPYVIEAGGNLYLFYTGMDRARRQRLGVAVSSDGIRWSKLRSNPILELGEYGSFDANGLGEPAVWASHGFWWLLYTGRAADEHRRIGLARSLDGVHWRKLPDTIISGDQPWDSAVVCDPSVLIENGQIRVWFGGGDTPRPDERIHGQIGVATFEISR